MAAIQEKMSSREFWDDNASSNKAMKELKALKATVDPFQKSVEKLKDLQELADIASEDPAFCEHIHKDLKILEAEINGLEIQTILGGEFDRHNAILSINAGAGGTESCDWASMLLRMYKRWADSRTYKIATLDILAGEEAGVKNVTLRIEGENAYGLLKSEKGVHRLVRISPFDANKRRHTSFASVDVIPEIEEDIAVDINPDDVRIDIFRSSGPGGQGVNTTDSAVRLTHLPTGIVVQCQNERSQLQNKQTAMKVLRARLYELKRQKQEERLACEYGEKMKIEWGSQIRSYVMHPYSMVKDHRTEVETGDVQRVMDGDLHIFIEAFLRMRPDERT